MLEVRHCSLGWAVWAVIDTLEIRLSEYMDAKRKAESYLDRLIRDKAERDKRWEAQIKVYRDMEAQTEEWIKSLKKHGNVRRIKDPTYFNKKQMDLLKAEDRKKLERMLTEENKNG